MAESIKVAVRVRPFNQREKDRNAELVVQMEGSTTIIKEPGGGKENKFNFDFSYWSHDGFQTRSDGYLEKASSSSRYCDQDRVFQDLGKSILNNAWDGYNATIFAYGQTGSGKSYSIVGYGANKGIVPVFADNLFTGITEKQGSEIIFEVEFSILEIYQEQVRDLLNPKTIKLKGGLKVRENPSRGFFVQGLQTVAVGNYAEIEARMEEGKKNRTIAATNMNATSSRAHTIVGITFVQKSKNATGEEMSKTSIINLVDLAGSERASTSGATGEHFKQGIAINLSLTMLGNVISALAERASSGNKIGIPFRQSVLTKLLKNALGGNSKTVMIAALSPADHAETLSTLRYADRVKQIKTVAKVNEDATAKLIRELQEENARLKDLLQQGGALTGPDMKQVDEKLTEKQKEEMRKEHEESMKAVVQENERKLLDMKITWEEKLRKAREKLREHGNQQNDEMAKKLKTTPHLFNLNADPQMNHVIIHLMEKGKQYLIGKPGERTNIPISGTGIAEQHAQIDCTQDHKIFIKIVDPDAKVRFNGQLLVPDDSMQLRHNDRLLFGTSHLYVFADPELYNSSPESFSEVTYEMAQDEISACIGISSAEERSKDAAVIRETMAELRPGVDEANSISQELDQKVKFDLLVVPPHHRGVDKGNTEVMVRMTHLENGMSWVWGREEFSNRKFIMQELYEDVSRGTKPSEENNPFVGDMSSPVLIGSSVTSPECLAHMIDIQQQFDIVGYDGQNHGVLNASLIPCDPKGKEITGEHTYVFIDDPLKLVGKPYKAKVKIENARGLPKRFTNVFVKYDMFLDENTQTKVVSGTNNPDFAFEISHHFKPVTAELISWLKNGHLLFQVWGKQQAVTVARRRRLGTRALFKNAETIQPQQTQSKWKTVSSDKFMKGILLRRCDNLERKLRQMRDMIECLHGKHVKKVEVSSMRKIVAESDLNAIDRLIEQMTQQAPSPCKQM